MLSTGTRDLPRMSRTSALMHPAAANNRWSIGEGPPFPPASTTEGGTPAGPPSKRMPSPLQRRLTVLMSGFGAAAAGASSEELIVLGRRVLWLAARGELGQGRAGVGDMLGRVAVTRRIVQERAQVAHRLFPMARAQQQEREPVVGARSQRILAQDVPIRLGRFVGHADARVGDRDLLQDHRIARMLLEREPERRQGLVELAIGQEREPFIVIVDPAGLVVAEKLVPPSHAG